MSPELITPAPRWHRTLTRRRVLVLSAAGLLSRATANAQGAMATVGFLSSRSPDESRHLVSAFLAGLGELGFIDGKNIAIEYRWALGRYDSLPAMALDLISRRVAVIFTAGGPPSAVAAKAATETIPIVFSAVNDPVSLGLVATLAHPGGNVTGMSTLTTGLATKAIQLIHEAVPQTQLINFMLNPSNPTFSLATEEAREAAKRAGLNIEFLRAATAADIATSFSELSGRTALVVYADPFFDSRREAIIGLAAEHGVPAIYPWRDYAVDGGLLSYGSSLVDSYRRAATYVGRILKGEKPADLPVQQPTRFELVINLKTAKALDLTVPQSIIARADEVIE